MAKIRRNPAENAPTRIVRMIDTLQSSLVVGATARGV